MKVKGNAEIEFTLSDDQVEDVVLKDLIRSYKTGKWLDDDEELQKCLIRVIKHYSTTYEYKSFCEEFNIGDEDD